MKTITTWAPPVAVSLLLHAVLLVLVAHQLSATPHDRNQLQTITVELAEQAPVSASKPRLPQSTPPVPAPPIQEPASAETSPIANTVPEESKTPVAAPGQTSTPSEDSKPSAETEPLAVQPLSKLTRPPAFLRKIEPVYPATEQRAGSQANVLAEVTINDKGNVLEVRIVKSAGKHFDEAVIEALKQSMFVPGYIDKEAVAVRVLVPFRFNLK